MKKKKSPVVEMTGQILDEIQTHNVLVHGHKEAFIDLLNGIKWNIEQSNNFSNCHTAQALGLTKGALRMFGVKS